MAASTSIKTSMPSQSLPGVSAKVEISSQTKPATSGGKSYTVAIKLKKPFNPGDTDPGKIYTHARIETVNIDLASQRIGAGIALGHYQDNGQWERGLSAPSYTLFLEGADFAAKAKTTTEENETVYDALARSLYEAAMEQGIVEGERE